MKSELIEYRVVGYIRESTRGQTVAGYRAGFQKDQIQNYAKKHRFKLVKTFEDSGSGKNLKHRPSFQEMLTFARENEIHFIIVEDITRFYRAFKDGIDIEDKLYEEHGIIVVDPEDYNPREYREAGISPQSWRQRAHRRVDAEGERRDIIKRVSDGYAEKKESRQYIGPLAYGIEWIDPEFPKYIRYKEPEAKIVKEIFKQCLAGNSCGQIARLLNDKKITVKDTVTKELKRSNGKLYFKKEVNERPFSYDMIRHILANKSYIGRQNTGNPFRLLTLDASEEEIDIEPLIEEDVFNRVQEKLYENRRGKNPRNRNSRQKERTYLFQGMIKHLDCGCAMHGVPERLRNGDVTRRYQCSGAKHGKCKAKQKSVRAEEIEMQVINLLTEVKFKDSNKIEIELKNIIKLTASASGKVNNLENLTLAQKGELKTLNEALNNGYDWMLKGNISSAERRLKELKRIAASKTEEMLNFYDFQEIRDVLSDLAGSFEKMQNLAARQEILSILFKEVFVGKPTMAEPNQHAAKLHWMASVAKDYELNKKATELKVLLRQFVPMLFQEIHFSEESGEIPVKKVIFKPTGLYLLAIDQKSGTKKKS